MRKLILGFCALCLFGSLGIAPAAGDIRTESSRAALTLPSAGTTDIAQEAALAGAGSSARPSLTQDMSDEEKERRREECNTAFEYCYDWCGRSTKFGTKARGECNDDCKRKLVDCMKRVPN